MPVVQPLLLGERLIRCHVVNPVAAPVQDVLRRMTGSDSDATVSVEEFVDEYVKRSSSDVLVEYRSIDALPLDAPVMIGWPSGDVSVAVGVTREGDQIVLEVSAPEAHTATLPRDPSGAISRREIVDLCASAGYISVDLRGHRALVVGASSWRGTDGSPPWSVLLAVSGPADS